MKKLIIAVVIFAAGTGAFFILQKSAFPDFYRYPDALKEWFGYVDSKGDKIQTVKEIAEKFYPTAKTTKRDEQISKDSPFGIHDPIVPEVDSMVDVAATGAKWVRGAGPTGIVWDAVEKQKGLYDWTRLDRIYSEAYKNGIRINVVVLVYNRLDSGEREFGYIPKNMDWYLEFLQKAVERYDGDGIDDAPGSPIVDVWEIDNELDLTWKDTPKNYALLLKKSYQIIKQANPSAEVAIAGIAEQGENNEGFRRYYTEIFKELDRIKDRPQDRYFDIISFHLFRPYNAKVKESIAEIKKELGKVGYNNVPIWITETADFSDRPSLIVPAEILGPVSYRSESEQASLLIKRYVYPLANGVKKIFWVTLTEWSGFGDSPIKVNSVWDNVGLVNNPRSDGKSHKKLAYYTYKKMVEVLERSDWANIQTIQESDGVYIYKFIKNNKPIWVAWNDNEQEKQITISGISSSQVKITEAVPKYEIGKEVTDYNTAFNTEAKTVEAEASKITLTLKDKPMFVEGR